MATDNSNQPIHTTKDSAFFSTNDATWVHSNYVEDWDRNPPMVIKDGTPSMALIGLLNARLNRLRLVVNAAGSAIRDDTLAGEELETLLFAPIEEMECLARALERNLEGSQLTRKGPDRWMGDMHAMDVTSDDHAPRYREGDKLMVRKIRNADIRAGDYIALLGINNTRVHRDVRSVEGNRIETVTINDEEPMLMLRDQFPEYVFLVTGISTVEIDLPRIS